MQQRRRETRFKIFTAEVVSLRLVSYSKAKAATFAQKESNGAIRRGRDNEANNYKKSVVAEANCFNIDLNRASHDR